MCHLYPKSANTHVVGVHLYGQTNLDLKLLLEKSHMIRFRMRKIISDFSRYKWENAPVLLDQYGFVESVKFQMATIAVKI